MESLLILVNIILAIILIIVILLQRSEGGALGLGVSQDNFTSARSVGTFLTKFTSIVAALFIICSIVFVGWASWYIYEAVQERRLDSAKQRLEKAKERQRNMRKCGRYKC